MTLYDKIIEKFPSIKQDDFFGLKPKIQLRNDGEGDYIEFWNVDGIDKPDEQELMNGGA